MIPIPIGIIITLAITLLIAFVSTLIGFYNFGKYQELKKISPNSALCSKALFKTILHAIVIPLVGLIIIQKTLQIWAIRITEQITQANTTSYGLSYFADPLTPYYTIHLLITILLIFYVGYIGYVNKWKYLKLGFALVIIIQIISMVMRSFLLLSVIDFLLIAVFTKKKFF
jgi:hypothetical protein